MKITKGQLKRLIKEELQESTMGRSTAQQDAEIKLANAVLDLQELRGEAYVANMLREMADDIEREAAPPEKSNREKALDAAYDAIIQRFGRGALMDPMKPMTPAEAEARMNPYVAPPLAPEDKPTETDRRYGRTRRGQKGGSLGS